MTTGRLAEAPRVSVVIPHYRDLGGLALCLSALERQTYPKERLEIVVADNNSPEGRDVVAQTIAGRADLVVITEKGAGPARNGGGGASSGGVPALLHPHRVAETARGGGGGRGVRGPRLGGGGGGGVG